MAGENKARVAAGLSTAAAIAAALAMINAGRARAATGNNGQELVLPAELVQLLAAIAASTDTIDSNVSRVITELSELAIEVQGWPANANSGTAVRVAIPVAGTQLPYIAVPSGMGLVVRAWPLNPGWLQVGFSLGECQNVNQSYPLLPNEVVGYFLENANKLYLAATAAACFVCLTVEQRKGGGV